MFDTMNIAKRIKQARIDKNMTQLALADAMGVSFQAVSNWERGVSLIKLLTLPEVNELMEHIFCLPNVQSAIYQAKTEHEKQKKEETPIGPVSSECHTN